MMKKLMIAFLLIFIAAGVSWAADATYGPKVYKTDGGDREVVASGGKVSVESGGTIDIESGGYVTGLALKIASIVMTAVDYTLSAAEMICNVLEVTGSGSSAAIIAPTATGRVYVVRNATDDLTDITIKVSGQTGVAIGTAKVAEVYSNGTDYRRKTADAAY